MRKYRFLLGAVLCALCFVSCTDSSKYVNALPDDAAAVVAVNLEQMAAKAKFRVPTSWSTGLRRIRRKAGLT